jgi:hypothetical protein
MVVMATIRLFAPTIVLLVWSAMWTLGANGHGLAAFMLFVLAISVMVSERERAHLRKERRDWPRDERND